MSTDEKLLVHLAEHLREMPDHDAPVSLRLPIRGIHDGEELRRAVQEAWRRGYFRAPQPTPPRPRPSTRSQALPARRPR